MVDNSKPWAYVSGEMTSVWSVMIGFCSWAEHGKYSINSMEVFLGFIKHQRMSYGEREQLVPVSKVPLRTNKQVF